MIYIMATPEKGDGNVVLGTASDVCVHLWGRPPGSTYPRYISSTLRAAREGTTYRGYTFQLLPGKPVLASRYNQSALHVA